MGKKQRKLALAAMKQHKAALKRQHRNAAASKKRRQGDGGVDIDPVAAADRARRAERFAAEESAAGVGVGGVRKAATAVARVANPHRLLLSSGQGKDDVDWTGAAVSGTCTAIEKDYVRLRDMPLPETVRPERVLWLSLDHAMRQYRTGAVSYLWTFHQLKSVRQDVTVQRLRGRIAACAYAAHARVALECGDPHEFLQCLTKLLELFADPDMPGPRAEFVAYAVLHAMLDREGTEADRVLHQLAESRASRDAPALQHAMQVHGAYRRGNVRRYFRLMQSAPNMSAFVMDLGAQSVRLRGLQSIIAAFRPTVPLSAVAKWLGFGPHGAAGERVGEPLPHTDLCAGQAPGEAGCVPGGRAGRARAVDLWRGSEAERSQSPLPAVPSEATTPDGDGIRACRLFLQHAGAVLVVPGSGAAAPRQPLPHEPEWGQAGPPLPCLESELELDCKASLGKLDLKALPLHRLAANG